MHLEIVLNLEKYRSIYTFIPVQFNICSVILRITKFILATIRQPNLSCYWNLHLKETAVEHSTLYFTTAVVFYIVTCF